MRNIDLALLLCLCTAACQQDALATQDKTMINLNSSIWQIIADTQEQEKINLAHVEKTLGHSLTENTEQSNELF